MAFDEDNDDDIGKEAEQHAANLQAVYDSNEALGFTASESLRDAIRFLGRLAGIEAIASESLRTKNWANSLLEGRSPTQKCKSPKKLKRWADGLKR
jgi:hypothetical protein